MSDDRAPAPDRERTAVVDPDGLVDLTEERDFLLRSLDDLDREHAAGELDDTEYAELRDDYTARAAAVIRAIDAGVVERPAPPDRRRSVPLAVAVVVTIVVAAVLLGRELGERTRDGTATGNAQIDSGTVTTMSLAAQQAEWERQRAAYAAAVEADPDDVDAHRRYGLFLLSPVPGSGLDPQSLVLAAYEFGAVVELRPDDVEALAYGGWALSLASVGAPDAEGRAQLLESALTLIDRAIAADPTYPDAQVFRGLTMIQGYDDPAGARPYLERYVELVPEGEYSEMVRGVLAGDPATTTAPAPSTARTDP